MHKTALASVGAASALALFIGGGTYAAFNDTETSAANDVAAGSVNLNMEPRAVSNRPGVLGVTPFNLSNMKPGDGTGVDTAAVVDDGILPLGAFPQGNRWRVWNSGSQQGHLYMVIEGVQNTEEGCNEPELVAEPACAADTAGELGDKMLITTRVGAPNTTNNPLQAGVNKVTLNSVIGTPIPLGTLAADQTSGNATSAFLFWELPTATGNEVQSDKVKFDVKLVLRDAPYAPAPVVVP